MRRYRSVALPAAAPADEAEMENWFRSTAAGNGTDDRPDNNPTRSPL
jgi:hypothetical protein